MNVEVVYEYHTGYTDAGREPQTSRGLCKREEKYQSEEVVVSEEFGDPASRTCRAWAEACEDSHLERLSGGWGGGDRER